MRSTPLMAGLLTLGVAASPALAQRVEELPRGARVQLVTVDGAAGRGYVDSVTRDAILLHVFEQPGEGSSVPYRRDLVRSMEVMQKHTAKGALRGGVLGLLIGAGGGFLLGALTYSDSDCDILACSPTEAGTFAAALGGMIGTPLGLLIGAARGSPEWRPVDLRR
jgi:hypothetical protein